MFEKIKNILGKPYFECKYGLLYNMDCEKALEKLNSPCLASTITSPPYNIGKEYEHIMPLDKYLDWLSRIATHVKKLTLLMAILFLMWDIFLLRIKVEQFPFHT